MVRRERTRVGVRCWMIDEMIIVEMVASDRGIPMGLRDGGGGGGGVSVVFLCCPWDCTWVLTEESTRVGIRNLYNRSLSTHLYHPHYTSAPSILPLKSPLGLPHALDNNCQFPTHIHLQGMQSIYQPYFPNFEFYTSRDQTPCKETHFNFKVQVQL